MPEFLQRNPLVLVLGGFAAALLVVIALEAGWGFGRTGAPASTAGKAAVVDSKLLPPLTDVAPEQVYPETGARPLFTPTRRPDPVAESVSSMVKGQFVLQGVTIMGDTRIAMLRDKTGGKIHRVEKGKDVNGVTVAEIEPERVTLRQGGDSEVIALTVQKPGAPAAAPAGAPPPSTVIGPFGAPVPAQQPAAAMPGISPAGAPPAPPRVPGSTPSPGVAPGAAPGPMPTPNPAARTPAPPTAASPSAAEAAATPEEILARRRARRAQQSQ